MEPEVDYLNVKQASDMLGIGESAVRERIRSGALPAIKTPKGWRIAVADLLESSGLNKAVSRYLCQFLSLSLAENFREIISEVATEAADRVIRAQRRDLQQTIGELHRELGRSDVKLELALEKVARLTGDLNAVVGELGRQKRSAPEESPALSDERFPD